MKSTSCVVSFLAACCGTGIGLVADEPGVLRFAAVDTSRLMGSPDPLPPMEFEPAFPNLQFERPVQPVHAGDGTNRMFVVTQAGIVHVFPNDPGVRTASVFLDIRDRVTQPGGDNGMFAVAFHPQFRSNGEFFVVYGTRARPKATVVSRFRVSADDPNRADPNSEVELLHIVQPWPDHNAACLAFGPDGFLYISLGDGGYSVENGNAQDLSTFLGAMLRIDVDERDADRNYGIPPDNPFIGVDGVREEIWAYGLRAPWRFSFDRITGDCWLGDNGQVEFEEINLIQPGDNYGWMRREGLHAFDPTTADARGRPVEREQRPREPELNRNDEYTDPIIEYDHSWGRSVVGGQVYRGTRLPELIGAYIYGDYGNGNIWALRRNNDEAVESRLIARTRLKISSFGEDEQGELLFSAMDGRLYGLRIAVISTEEPEFPNLLSNTGLFESVEDLEPVAGCVPYDVNVPLWSDGATKDRFVALSGTGSVTFRESGTWGFSVGTVFVKTFSLESTAGDPDSRYRIETRLLVRNPRGWVGYTYRWNDAQTDAVLLGGAATQVVQGADGSQSWYFPSRADCMTCHTRAAGFVLGANTRQLNRPHTYGRDSVNQIAVFAAAGLFHEPLSSSPETLPAYHDWKSQSGTLVDRARAYLDVNCATCHTPPAYTRLDLRRDTTLLETMTINRPPEKPRIGPLNSRLIVPGRPGRSELLLRMQHQGAGRMPNIASTLIDADGVEVISAWIESLDPGDFPQFDRSE